MTFLIGNNIFSGNQHGFLKGRKIESAIFAYVNKILNAYEDHELALGIFLDVSKFYVTINHEFSLLKLDCYGIRNFENDYFMVKDWPSFTRTSTRQCIRSSFIQHFHQ